MAVTVSAQSAFHREPSWDETIVPTLRKRLEDESRFLGNRLSTVSIGDEGYSSTPHQPFSQFSPNPKENRAVSPSSSVSRPSAIPRPSHIRGRPSESGSRSSQTSTVPSSPPQQQVPYRRPRTHSQPYVLPEPDSSSRAKSPDFKPTRIPRARTPSISGNDAFLMNGRNGQGINGNANAIASIDEAYTSRSTITLSGRSGIINEPAPFHTPSASSLQSDQHQSFDIDPARPSTDTEEHPFEHWYRGDTARNGGVGELRVGRRQEMLEIASYGHTLRNMPSVSSGGSRPGDTCLSARGTSIRGRKRAESLGPRESFYLDSKSTETPRVMDEDPLTDLDDGLEYNASEDEDYGYTSQSHMGSNANGAVSSPSLLSGTGSPKTSLGENPSSPTSTSTARSKTPVQSTIAAGRTSNSSSSSTRLQAQRSQSQPRLYGNQVSAATSNAKGRGKSPGASNPARKPKSRPPPRQQHLKKDEDRRSVAEYPYPRDDDGVDLADAVPVWSQPKVNGNWDEVVPPAVARKKGLNGLYEKTDGNAQPQKLQEIEPAPAPGTFGFDYSKYKPSRGDQFESIPLDEFGRQDGRPNGFPADGQHNEQGRRPMSMQDDRPIRPMRTSAAERAIEEDRRMRMQLGDTAEGRNSPPPFAHYEATTPELAMVEGAKAAAEQRRRRQQGEDEEDSRTGCCKCVVM